MGCSRKQQNLRSYSCWASGLLTMQAFSVTHKILYMRFPCGGLFEVLIHDHACVLAWFCWFPVRGRGPNCAGERSPYKQFHEPTFLVWPPFLPACGFKASEGRFERQCGYDGWRAGATRPPQTPQEVFLRQWNVHLVMMLCRLIYCLLTCFFNPCFVHKYMAVLPGLWQSVVASASVFSFSPWE